MVGPANTVSATSVGARWYGGYNGGGGCCGVKWSVVMVVAVVVEVAAFGVVSGVGAVEAEWVR